MAAGHGTHSSVRHTDVHVLVMFSPWLQGMEHIAVPCVQGSPNAVHGRVGGGRCFGDKDHRAALRYRAGKTGSPG